MLKISSSYFAFLPKGNKEYPSIPNGTDALHQFATKIQDSSIYKASNEKIIY